MGFKHLPMLYPSGTGKADQFYPTSSPLIEQTAWKDRHRTKGLEHSLKKKAHVDESEIDHTSSVREIETAICDTVGHGYNETAICLIADDSLERQAPQERTSAFFSSIPKCCPLTQSMSFPVSSIP